MFIANKLTVLSLLVVLISIEPGLSASKLEDTPRDLCKEKDREDFNLKLRATFLSRNSLILIDHDWLVYTVPYSNINNSYSQLIGKPFKEQWPAFKEYLPWKSIKPKVTSIYHVDVKTPFLYIFAQGIQGLCYNLNTEEFCIKGLPGGDQETILYITDNGATLFTIQLDNGHVWFWAGNDTWYENGQQGDSSLIALGYMYCTWNRTMPNVKNITVIDESVQNASSVISPDFAIENIDWALKSGFVYKGYFHFFGYNNVYTFAVSPLKPIDYSHYPPLHATNPVTITSVKDFFKCGNHNVSGCPNLPCGIQSKQSEDNGS